MGRINGRRARKVWALCTAIWLTAGSIVMPVCAGEEKVLNTEEIACDNIERVYEWDAPIKEAEDLSEELPYEPVSHTTDDLLSEKMDEIQDDTTEALPDDIFDEEQNDTTNGLPDDIFDEEQNDITNGLPGDIFDGEQNDTTNGMPDNTSGGILNETMTELFDESPNGIVLKDSVPDLLMESLEDAYAILYDNGELVFQRGNTPDPDKGTVIETYTGFENASYYSYGVVPWNAAFSSIQSVSFKDEIHPVSIAYWFYSCENLSDFNTVNLTVDNLTSMKYAFYKCKSLNTINTTGWNLANVKNMASTFKECSSLTGLDSSNWNLTAISDMNSIFYNCKNLSYLDTSGWNLSGLKDLRQAFYCCNSLTYLDTSGWNLSNVTDLYYTFYECEKLKGLNTSLWGLESVTNMYDTFGKCKSLEYLDTSGWSLANVRTMNYTFDRCTGLTAIDTSGWVLPKLEMMDHMFSECEGLTAIDTSGWDLSSAAYMRYTFYQCTNLKVIDASGWNLSSITNMQNMFLDCTNLERLELGENFRFVYRDARLPGEKWMRKSTGEKFTPDELYTTYDGASMADTYYRVVSIIFNANGGIAVPGSMEGYLGVCMETLPEASKKGSYFTGWFTQLKDGQQIQAGNLAEQTTYYAHWEDYRYILVLKYLDENMEDTVLEMGYNDFYSLPARIESDEKVIGSWNTRKNGTGTLYQPGETVTRLTLEDGGTVILYAQWSQKETGVTLSFDTRGGTEIESRQVKAGTIIGTCPVPVRDGYTFVNWHWDSADGTVVTGKEVISQDVTLYAEWKKNPVVTFDSNGGGPQSTQRIVRYNSKVGGLPVYEPNSNRYMSLIGWFTQPSGGEQITGERLVTEDVTFYAHWGWRPKFNANGGMITEEEEYPLLESPEYLILKLPEVIRDGYRLEGWYLGDGVTPVQDGDTVDLSNGIEIAARWVRSDTVNLTLVLAGGQIDGSREQKNIEVYSGIPVGELPVPVKEEYKGYPVYRYIACRFMGWQGDDGSLYDGNSAFDRDMVLTAQWQNRSVVLTFDWDGGSSSGNKYECLAPGETLNILPGGKKTNYILEGWYTQKEGNGERLTVETQLYEDTVYYANWIPFWMNASDENAMYTYGAEWSNASNGNVNNLEDHLIFHPTDTQNQTAQLHVRFELNQSIGDVILPVGAVKIRVPRYVWKDWDGNPAGTNNISANLPQYPNVRNGMWFSYMEEGDYYVILNSVEMAGGAGVDLTLSYQVSPWIVPGGAMNESGEYLEGYDYFHETVPVQFSVDKELDGVNETEVSKELLVEMHTRMIGTPSKTCKTVSYTWNDAWGTKPSDAADYFYITWECQEEVSYKNNQPADISWSEDTVHDGTVIYHSGKTASINTNVSIYYSTVVTKHPISLLSDIPESGLVLKNQALLTEKWRSGYQVTKTVEAFTVLYDSEYPMGEFDKHRPSGTQMLINGGQEDIADDKKDVTMSWELVYNGGSNVIPLWDEDTGTYSAAHRTIRIRDGVQGDVMHSSGEPAAKYVWEPVTGNSQLSDEDYIFSKLSVSLTEYDARQVDGVWTDRYVHEDTSTIEGVEIWVRYKNTNDFVFFTNVYPGSDPLECVLPEGTVGFDVKHGSDFFSTRLSVTAIMKLRPTLRVQALIQDDIAMNTTSIIKNKAVCDIWPTGENEENIFFHATNYTGGNNPANKEIYELNTSVTRQITMKRAASQGNTVFDVDRGTQDNPVSISGWNYNTSYRLKCIRTGIFYDLLPAGTSVDVSTMIGVPVMNMWINSTFYRGNIANDYDNVKNSVWRLNRENYDVRFVDNWEGSQRTMMIIKFTIPDSYKANGVDFYYMLHNTYENIIENGTTVENDVAFINTTEGRVLPAELVSDINVIDEKQYYDSLQTKYIGCISYSSASTNYIPVDAFSWGFDKAVKTQNEYEYEGITLLNNAYTYRLVYSQSDYAESSDIVFYDVLEYGVLKEEGLCLSMWQGILENVNVKSVSEKLTDGSSTVHCAPVIYYSIKNRAEFTGADYDISNQDTWTVTKPTDPELITAVAVDCSKNEDGSEFVLKGQQAMEIYITMRAPVNEELIGKTAYNEGVVYSRKSEDEQATPAYSDCSVILQDVSPGISKSSEPKSGTRDAPAGIRTDEEIKYGICAENPSDTFTLYDVVICDRIPESVNIDLAGIRIHFGNPDAAMKISASPRAFMKKNGYELQFTVSSLLPAEKVYLEIPVIVAAEEGKIENTASIISVNGVDKTLISETTYHEIGMETHTLTVRKTVSGNMGDKSEEFGFQLKLTENGSGKSLESICCEEKDFSEILYPDEEGMFEFTLTHGESIVFKEIPAGTVYEITEKDGEALGYQVVSENASGMIENKDMESLFTNTKNVSISTSVDIDSPLSLLFVLLAGLFLLLLTCRIQKAD